ncbi:MAG: DUF4340 domain-containing protein [Ruminococcaceae bacterium]|nr:DUF4340 domain-containing protein [Oscillospiraceae bacterium]
MKKKSLKKLITLAVLAAVLAGLIIGSALLKKAGSVTEDTPEENNSVVVFDKGTAIVTSIRFKTKDNEMSFSYVNDDWVYDKDNNFPLDQDGVASMAQSIGKISATVTLENPSDDLSEYGLDKPSVTVDAVFSDKSEKTFLFGDTNNFNSCIYFKIVGDDHVYMVEEALSEPFAADLDYLYEPEIYTLQKDSVTASDVTSVTLTTVKDSAEITNEITDERGISKLYELFYTLDLSQYEDYFADSEEMKSSYGISPEGERFTVVYTAEDPSDSSKTVEKEYTVYIGHKFETVKEEETTDTGSDTTSADKKAECFYFYTFEGSTVVYSADGDTVDEIFTYLSYKPTQGETTEN